MDQDLGRSVPDGLSSATPIEPVPVSPLCASIPSAIRELVLSIGEAEWGQTFAHDAEGHAEHIAESVRKTAAHFGQTEDQHMHGLYLKGTETVICHTGTSPNSPKIAQAMTGAWNWLLAECQAQGMSAGTAETGTGSGLQPASPVPQECAQGGPDASGN